ncbi:unnamed protein product [Pedinophyceae sp. YPF-701]|nr:unnamed protein product [Pedinophyceae sp. YPF-701]
MALPFDDLLEGLTNEAKEAETRAKPQEEVEALLVDESLDDLEKAKMFLERGVSVQQQFALGRLPVLAREFNAKALSELLPIISEKLTSYEKEDQIAVAHGLRDLITEGYVNEVAVRDHVLPIVLKNFTDPEEGFDETVDEWAEALHACAKALPQASIEAVYKKACKMGDDIATVEDRENSCFLTGAVCGRLGRAEVEGSLLGPALRMCQDSDKVVRRSMCKQLSYLSRALGPALTEERVIAEVLELLYDEEELVKEQAFHALVDILDLVSPACKRERILPRLCTFWQDLMMQPTLPIGELFSKLNGAIVLKLAPGMEEEERRMLVSCMRSMASPRSPLEVRQNTAYNLFGVMQALGRDFAESGGLLGVLSTLAQDPEVGVRKTVAALFHEVCAFLGHPAAHRLGLLDTFKDLMSDDDQRVPEIVLKNLMTTLPALEPESASMKGDVYRRVLDAMVAAREGSGNNWRLQKGLAEAFPSTIKFLPPEVVHERVVPQLSALLSPTVAAAVHGSAGRALVEVLRMPKLKSAWRTEVYMKMVKDFGRGRACWQRQVFVEMCRALLASMSTKFFRDYFFDWCVDIMNDSVANVRLSVASLLPDLKQTIRLPEDVEYLDRLNTAISSLMTDNDRDVSMFARAMNEKFKARPFRMARAASSSAASSFEAEDRKREVAEQEIVLLKDEVDKARYALMCDRTRNSRTRMAGDSSVGGVGVDTVAQGRGGAHGGGEDGGADSGSDSCARPQVTDKLSSVIIQ